MDCDTFRAAISTQIDGEAPWLPAGALTEHLTDCPDCVDWQRRAHALTRRVRLGGAFLDHDLTPAVLAAIPAPRDRRRVRLARRGALVLLALAQFAIAAPMLFLGHDREAGVHAAHELGSFNLALAIAFAVGAIRPKLSAGLAWPCAIAAGGLVTTAVIDLIGGQAIGPDEAQHLVALAGAALLVWQARAIGSEVPAAAAVPGESPVATSSDQSADLGAAVLRPGSALRRPWGGDAARLTAPVVAAAPTEPSDGEQAREARTAASASGPGPGQPGSGGHGRERPAPDEEVA